MTASQRRHAELAYTLDRALKQPASTTEFVRTALDVLRLGLRPAYAALVWQVGPNRLHCGDQALYPELDEVTAALRQAPRSVLAAPRSIERRSGETTSLAPLAHAMTASALDVVFPLVVDGVAVGAFALGPRRGHRPYDDDDLEFCDRIGARLTAAVARDVLAAQMARLRGAAEEAGRLAAVGSMAAGLAHEIRNPLVSIRTFTQLLPERHDDAEFREGFLDLTLSEIDRISTLAGELLRLARPDPDSSGEDEKTVDLESCLRRTCLLLQAQARSAGVRLECEVAEDLPAAAIGEDRLRQVLVNLVANGIHACEGGGRVRVKALAGANGRLAVEVRDDGCGMSPDVVARIFEPFFTTRSEGTGLGLAVVHRLVEEHGGTLSVRSAAREGSTFCLDLPAAEAGSAASWTVEELAVG